MRQALRADAVVGRLTALEARELMDEAKTLEELVSVDDLPGLALPVDSLPGGSLESVDRVRFW